MNKDFIAGYVEGIAEQCVTYELSNFNFNDSNDLVFAQIILVEKITLSLQSRNIPQKIIESNISRIFDKYQLWIKQS